jgi:streptogramin lyase
VETPNLSSAKIPVLRRYRVLRPRYIFLLTLCALFRAPLVWGQPTIIEYSLTTAVGNPTVIVKDPDGNLWTLTYPSNRIAKIAPSGTVTSYAFPSGSLPAALAAGPDGSVWFADPLGNRVGKITPDGVITGYPLPTRGSMGVGITAGPDGNIWFTEPD